MYVWYVYTFLYVYLYHTLTDPCQVMADVHAIQTYSLANIVTSLGVGGLLASLLGPLSYTTSFLLIEWYKMALVHFVGISNMSVLLQILIIMDIGWGKSFKSSIIF